jgi:large subunit ribosomal protein L22
MSKQAKAPRRKENQAIAKARYVKGSERKLNLLAQLIRGKSAQKALIDLEFSHKRMSNDVYKVLQAAIANAENNHNLDADRLFVSEATVGKTLVMGRFHARGRGRSAAIEKPMSNITIVVQERNPNEDLAAKGKKAQKREAAKAAGKTPTAKTTKKPAAKAAAKAGE